MSDKKKKDQAPAKQEKEVPPGMIPIDSDHFYKIPLLGSIDCTK